MGPLLMTLTQKHFMLALTNYYSKWITVKAYANTKEKDVRMFGWKHMIYQFRIPNEIVVDIVLSLSVMSLNIFVSTRKYS